MATSKRPDAALLDHFAKEDPKHIPDRTRQAVLDRDNHQCQACGTGGENRLQLHHLIYRSAGGGHGGDNLITLCVRCHRDLHDDRLDVVLLETHPGVFHAFCHRKTFWTHIR